MVPAAVTRTLDAFKAGVDAYDLAAFDGWHGRTHLPDATSPGELWDAIRKLACLETDWNPFKSNLVRVGESEVGCRCGAHFVTGFLIQRRWSLIVFGRQSLAKSELVPIRMRTMEKLARLLPHLDEDTAEPSPGDPRGGGGTAGPAELGIPLWWIRRSN